MFLRRELVGWGLFRFTQLKMGQNLDLIRNRLLAANSTHDALMILARLDFTAPYILIIYGPRC